MHGAWCAFGVAAMFVGSGASFGQHVADSAESARANVRQISEAAWRSVTSEMQGVIVANPGGRAVSAQAGTRGIFCDMGGGGAAAAPFSVLNAFDDGTGMGTFGPQRLVDNFEVGATVPAGACSPSSGGGECTDFNCVASNDDGATATAGQSEVTFAAEPNRPYYIRLGGSVGVGGGGASGNYEIGATGDGDTSAMADACGCLCEFDDDPTGVDIQDLLAFLALWIVNDSEANINGGFVDVTDLLDFLCCWFPASAGTPCP